MSARGGYHRFDMIQPGYSLIARGVEKEIFPLCRLEGVSISTYSPLGAGLLTGIVPPDRSQAPKGTRFYVAPDYQNLYYSESSFRIVELLRAKAGELGLPMTRLAMAWVLSSPDVTSMLVGADNVEQLDEAISAYEMGLDPAVRAEMSGWS